jgi:hypothetical protein
MIISLTTGLSSISTNPRHRLSAAPEIPDVISANEKDQRFLHTGSPMADNPPTKIKDPARISHACMSLILLPFYSAFLFIIKV